MPALSQRQGALRRTRGMEFKCDPLQSALSLCSGFYFVHASPAGIAFVRTWLGRFAVSDDGEQWDKQAFRETLHYKASPIRCDCVTTPSQQAGTAFHVVA